MVIYIHLFLNISVKWFFKCLFKIFSFFLRPQGTCWIFNKEKREKFLIIDCLWQISTQRRICLPLTSWEKCYFYIMCMEDETYFAKSIELKYKKWFQLIYVENMSIQNRFKQHGRTQFYYALRQFHDILYLA